MPFLSDSFLEPYKTLQPANKGLLFYPVYLRTYSRWIEEEKRRERWWETVRRVVEYSFSLYSGHRKPEELVEEAEKMFDAVFHLRLLPAGRALWIGGTEAVEKFGESAFNCSFCVVDELNAFWEAFQLLLCGCGVGFRVLTEDVDKLPGFWTHCRRLEVEYVPYSPKAKEDRYEKTSYSSYGDWVDIEIGDSREGWVRALQEFLCAATWLNNNKIRLNFDNIRPEGERIKGFGGRAPGPDGLIEMFRNITTIINRAALTKGKLLPVDAMDIMNFIGKNVIVGGTRRSSQIALGSIDDIQFIEAKKDLWTRKDNLQRTMSNNSVILEHIPDKGTFLNIFETIRTNGEPGFVNLEEMRRRRPNAQGGNPCLEISLDSKGFCNLCTVNIAAFVDKNARVNINALLDTVKLASRISLRATNVTVSLPEWDAVQKRDRLLGISLTGIMDFLDNLPSDYPINWVFRKLRQAAREEARNYAFEMRVPEPLLVTCIKPEGSLSQLPTVSSGIHRAYAPFYIRRIRVSTIDPVCKALQSIGIANEPDRGKSERIVFSFPIKTSAKQSSLDEPAVSQFQRYLDVMEHYVDHNCSITISVGEREWGELADKVYDNLDKVVGCAFLPKYTDAFPQMPYEEITAERYEELMQNFPSSEILDSLPEIVDRFENETYTEDELDVDCSSGYCPVK